MAIVEDRGIYPQMLILSDCLCEALAKRGWDDLCWCSVVPGEDIPWDVGLGNSDCGTAQAWVRLVQVADISETPGRCAPRLSYTLELGVAFTVESVLGDRGELPTVEDMVSDTAKQVSSMRALYDAVCCLMEGDDVDVTYGQYASIGPVGGALGNILLIDVEINA